MAVYTIKRIAVGIASLFVLATVTFFLTRMIPGSPFQSGNVSSSVVEAVEEQYGLDRPAIEQYGTYMGNLLKGDLGISYKQQGVRVSDIIGRAAPVTASLGLLAVLAAALAGTILGMISALSKRKALRAVISGGTLLGVGIPNFALGLILLLLFGVTLKVLPVYPAAVVTRLTDTAFREEMEKEYVLLARAKGMKPWKIVVFHVLKNAWIPVLNYLGPMSAFLLTGSFVVESIFNIPGLGKEFVSSISNRDYTLILGLTIFMGSAVILINLLTDLLCALLDARVREAYLRKR